MAIAVKIYICNKCGCGEHSLMNGKAKPYPICNECGSDDMSEHELPTFWGMIRMGIGSAFINLGMKIGGDQ